MIVRKTLARNKKTQPTPAVRTIARSGLLLPSPTGVAATSTRPPTQNVKNVIELPMDTAFGDGLGKGGKAGKPPPGAEMDLRKKRQKTNDLVQNYLDSLDPDQPMDDADQGGPPR